LFVVFLEYQLKLPSKTIISYWKPEVSVKLVTDFNHYPKGHTPFAVQRNSFGFLRKNERLYYRPDLYVDEIGLTTDKYIHLNSSVLELPLKVSVSPMSPQRWHLITKIEETLQIQSKEKIGGFEFSPSDIDDFRR
jgi:hypothetical protein